MNKVVRWLVIIALLIAAIGSYIVGSTTSLGIFLVIGVLFELCFWFGLFSYDRKNRRINNLRAVR